MSSLKGLIGDAADTERLPEFLQVIFETEFEVMLYQIPIQIIKFFGVTFFLVIKNGILGVVFAPFIFLWLPIVSGIFIYCEGVEDEASYMAERETQVPLPR